MASSPGALRDLDAGAFYAEGEVNEALARWLDEGCPSLGVDVVTLRRHLVDDLYLDRDDSGRHYSPCRGPVGWRFDDEVASIEPIPVISAAREGREQRTMTHINRAATIDR